MDYNIYIRSAIGDQSNPLIPWKPNSGKTSAWESAVTESADALANPDAIVHSATQAGSAIVKAIPYVAAAYAVIKLSSKAFETAHTFVQTETGDYRLSVAISNFRQTINNIFNPFATAINYAKAQQAYRLENKRNEQMRELLGESAINQKGGRGV